ncbi:LysR family transcriptional regulator [Aurantiacibacter rhizosphaerae]|uniref:LysR family transcriptional regulator n=1 Tax=Aurantiacibacter rhizosphaerae TaxID=2691582 RepID=UPI00136572D2
MIISGLPFTLRQLEIFAHLAETSSFRTSAEQLGISQASVSNQLKVLEEQLGLTLFERKSGRKPVLTPEGRAFETDLEDFAHAAQVLAAHKSSGGDIERPITLRLLVGQGMFDFYIRQKLDRFFSSYPQIELDFETHPPTPDIARILRKGGFDFALINLRDGYEEPAELKSLALVDGGIYGHRDLAKGKTLPLTAEEVSELPFVLPPAGSKHERDSRSWLASSGIRPRKIVGHSQYYDVMSAMLERGVAVAPFSNTMLRPEARKYVVELMPLVMWRMMLFRRPAAADPRRDIVEQFLIDCTIRNPDFPVVTIYDEALRDG